MNARLPGLLAVSDGFYYPTGNGTTQSFTAGIDGALTRIELFGRLQSTTQLFLVEVETVDE